MPKKEIPLATYSYSFEDLPKALGQLGELQRERQAEADLTDSKVNELQGQLAEILDPIDREIKKISQSIKKFMDEHKSDYISETKKTLKLETGDLSYRTGQTSVETRSDKKFIGQILEANNLVKVKENFEKIMHSVFIRTKLELDKELILANPEAAVKVTNVKLYSGTERFYLKPYATSTELEVV